MVLSTFVLLSSSVEQPALAQGNSPEAPGVFSVFGGENDSVGSCGSFGDAFGPEGVTTTSPPALGQRTWLVEDSLGQFTDGNYRGLSAPSILFSKVYASGGACILNAGRSRFALTNLVFSGPPGATVVSNVTFTADVTVEIVGNAAYSVSSSLPGGTTTTISSGVPRPSVSVHRITFGPGTFALNTPQTFEVTLNARCVNFGSAEAVMQQSSCGPAFNLPPGYSVSGSGIISNHFTGPSIRSINPVQGLPGECVIIEGCNFDGATSVVFNGVPASFTGEASARIIASVPATATRGPITVTTPTGTIPSAPEFVVAAPSETVFTIAGTGAQGFSGDGGPAASAVFGSLQASAVGPDGAIYFADADNFRIRRIDPLTQVVTTIAGDGSIPDFFSDNGDGGQATDASVAPWFMALDRARNVLYFSDYGVFRVRKINLTTGIISNFAGTSTPEGIFPYGLGGPATDFFLFNPTGLAVDPRNGDVYIADLSINRLFRVSIGTGLIHSYAGSGDLIFPCDQSTPIDGIHKDQACFYTTIGVAVDVLGNVFVLDLRGSTHYVRRIDAATGIVTTVAGGGTNRPGPGFATNMRFNFLNDITVNPAGTALFIANDSQIFKVDLTTGLMSVFAGAGPFYFYGDGGQAVDAMFWWPTGLSLAPNGDLIVCDLLNFRIRRIVPPSPIIRTPPPASCNAGPDFSVNEGDTVSLSGSSGGAGALLWTQLSGTPVTLSNATFSNPSFTAPQVASGGETLTFKLTRTTACNTGEDTVNITVVNLNHIPVADAGPDQTVAELAPVTLHGENSFDCDNDVFDLTWVQVSGPTVTLSDPTSANPTFTAPEMLAGGNTGVVATVVFKLEVSDSYAPDTTCSGFSSNNIADIVEIKVTNVDNAPNADAGADQTVAQGAAVVLHAENSSDPDSDVLTFAWSQIGGPTVVLTDTNASNPTFAAPAVGPGGTNLTFELLVDDGFGGTDVDQVVIHVQNANDPPVGSLAQPTLPQLWPPTHGLVEVGITGVSDPQNDPVIITITSVTQDEPTQGLGGGDTAPDAVIQGPTVLLRAERSAKGNGRVYRINFTATDGQGGSCLGLVIVFVPHDRKDQTAVDDGQNFDSTQ